MWQTSNGTWTCFFPKHLNHVNGFLLFRNMCSAGSSHKIVGISSHVNLTWKSSYILDESSQHLTSSITVHQCMQLSNSGTQSCSFDLGWFNENQGTFVFLLLSLRGSAMKTTIARCDVVKLFLNAASGMATNLGSPWSAQNVPLGHLRFACKVCSKPCNHL